MSVPLIPRLVPVAHHQSYAFHGKQKTAGIEAQRLAQRDFAAYPGLSIEITATDAQGTSGSTIIERDWIITIRSNAQGWVQGYVADDLVPPQPPSFPAV